MKLIIVRHGETEENAASIIQGQSVQGKLSENGIKQVEKVAEKLKKIKIDVILTSDLKRTLDTAKIIARFHPESEFIATKDLRERNWGEFEGKNKVDLKWNKLKYKYQKTFEKPKNGESLDELHRRVGLFFQGIKKNYQKGTILIVSHSSFIKILIGIIREKHITEMYDFGFVSHEGIYEFKI